MWTVVSGVLGFLGGVMLGAVGGYLLGAIEVMKADILLARIERHTPPVAPVPGNGRTDGDS